MEALTAVCGRGADDLRHGQGRRQDDGRSATSGSSRSAAAGAASTARERSSSPSTARSRCGTFPTQYVERLRRAFPAPHVPPRARPTTRRCALIAGRRRRVFAGRSLASSWPRRRRLRWIHSPAAGVGGMLFPEMVAQPGRDHELARDVGRHHRRARARGDARAVPAGCRSRSGSQARAASGRRTRSAPSGNRSDRRLAGADRRPRRDRHGGGAAHDAGSARDVTGLRRTRWRGATRGRIGRSAPERACTTCCRRPTSSSSAAPQTSRHAASDRRAASCALMRATRCWSTSAADSWSTRRRSSRRCATGTIGGAALDVFERRAAAAGQPALDAAERPHHAAHVRLPPRSLGRGDRLSPRTCAASTPASRS